MMIMSLFVCFPDALNDWLINIYTNTSCHYGFPGSGLGIVIIFISTSGSKIKLRQLLKHKEDQSRAK